MPPAPHTRAVAPGSTFAVLTTAPTPVWMAQPITQAISRGVSGSRRTTLRSLTTVSSPNPATPSPRLTGSPPRASGVVPSGRRPVENACASTHAVASPRLHQ